jgi:hypothetical protein
MLEMRNVGQTDARYSKSITTCYLNAERSHSHRGFSPVDKLTETILEPFPTVSSPMPSKTVETVRLF